MRNLKYPVILENEFDMGAFSSESKMCICGEQSLDEGFMENTFIIDSEGGFYEITEVNKLQNISWVPTFLIPYKSRIVKVRFNLEYINKLDFLSIKKRILNVFMKNKVQRSKRVISRINKAENMNQLFNAIGID